ncbi:hypothetical protein AAF712_011393 [Marasmius tenuissimus]|uniref:Uncharacterized protein n=1 Tax=Marasmius tenuissimus TaxID=585030 RepID=A0ABR2ZM50_9AGAR
MESNNTKFNFNFNVVLVQDLLNLIEEYRTSFACYESLQQLDGSCLDQLADKQWPDHRFRACRVRPIIKSLSLTLGTLILISYATLLAAQNAPAQLSLISHLGQPTTMRFSTFTNGFAIPVGTKTFSNDAETTYVDTREKRVQATYVVSVEGFRLTDLPIEGEGSVVIKCGNFSDDTSEATECVVEVSGPRVTANGNKFQATVPGGMFVVPVSTGRRNQSRQEDHRKVGREIGIGIIMALWLSLDG